MKICSVVGTRPNLVKEWLVNREFQQRGIQEVLIHTGQHYDYEMSQVFFDSFDLPAPHFQLHVANADSVMFSAQAIVELATVFRAEKPKCVLSYGDVNSTMSAAIAASKLRIPFVHVEGGIRGGDRYNPEEINRRVSDVLSDLIFCCTAANVRTLEKEGYEPDRVEFSGDLMNDALMMTLSRYGIEPSRGNYNLLTLHRQENLTDCRRLRAIIEGIVKSRRRVIFPAHPRTVQSMKGFGLLELLTDSPIELRKPAGYVEFVRLAAGADKILTDSGGVRREAYFLRKPCVVLTELSWFPEISQAGWKVLTGPEPDRIADLIVNFEPTGPYQELFGNGSAHRRIVETLVRKYAE
jgi:UDP-N-acetylglucosamine 2-epimerase (non-hydrolysing)